MVGCGQPGVRTGWGPVRPPKGGFLYSERDDNYAGLVPKLIWVKTRGSRDDDNFFTKKNDFVPTH